MKCINKFSDISGLECNIHETKVILIGDFDRVNKIFQDINLSWKNEFNLLGFLIDNRLETLKSNLWVINTKVKNLNNRWKLYYLSFHGGLTIVRSILLSQYV